MLSYDGVYFHLKYLLPVLDEALPSTLCHLPDEFFIHTPMCPSRPFMPCTVKWQCTFMAFLLLMVALCSIHTFLMVAVLAADRVVSADKINAVVNSRRHLVR